MTSPEVSIEPARLVLDQRSPEVTTDPLLTESSSGDSDRLPDCCPELSSQPLELLVGLAIDTNTCTGQHNLVPNGVHDQRVGSK